MINPNSDLAGGWPTPLKNDGLRQLGWWFFPRLMDKSSSHVPVTTKQFPILPWPLWGDPIFSCAQGGWRWLVLEPPVPSLLMSGMKVWLFFNPNGVYIYIYNLYPQIQLPIARGIQQCPCSRIDPMMKLHLQSVDGCREDECTHMPIEKPLNK